MKYQVIVTPDAQAAIRESFTYIHERSPLNEARWLQALLNSEDFAFQVGSVRGIGTGAPPDGRVISVVLTLVVPPTEEQKQIEPQQ